ncbi:MAG: hypothetical protein ACXV7D_13000, partial [Thermoanaerobaculia bacterium]
EILRYAQDDGGSWSWRGTPDHIAKRPHLHRRSGCPPLFRTPGDAPGEEEPVKMATLTRHLWNA